MEESPRLLIDGPSSATRTVALAHGAGAPMDSGFMETISTGLSGAGLRVVRFEFPYMAERRRSGKRAGPNRMPILEATWRTVIESLGSPDRLWIGGKSMGGRIASRIADEAGVAGLICLGYPFHPAGRPERLRTAHLAELSTSTLILQGTRDSLGAEDEIGGYTLSSAIRIVYLPDGDHSFRPRKSSGRTLEQNMADAIGEIERFVLDG